MGTLRKEEGKAAGERVAEATGNEQRMHTTAASNAAGENWTVPGGAAA